MSKTARYSAVGDENGDKSKTVRMSFGDDGDGDGDALRHVPWRLGSIALLVTLVVGLVLGAALGEALGESVQQQLDESVAARSADQHGYDHRLSYRLLLYSDAIYCRPRDVLRWDCPVCDSLPAFTVSGIAGDVAEAVSTLVGYDAALDAIVVSFRGTVLGSGLRDSAGHEPTAWGFSAAGLVRTSSVRRYDSHRADLHQLLATTVAMHPSAPVYMTGHSLGGAQSLISASDLPAAHPHTNFTVFAFAPYRQSSQEWNEAVSAQPNLQAVWRINHRYDEIPGRHDAWGDRSDSEWTFAGLGREVWYPNDADDVFLVGDESGEDPNLLNSIDPSLLNHADHDWYLGHNMWCCSEHQAKFSWDLTLGPFSPNPDWRTASGVGEDTICDFPFGCSNCDCESDGTDDSPESYGYPRISPLGCPAAATEEDSGTASSTDGWYPGLRQIPQSPEQAAENYRAGNPLRMNGPCAYFEGSGEDGCEDTPGCQWFDDLSSCEVALSDPHRMQAVRMTSAAARDNAVCLDGSVPVFYFRPGSGSGANKWHIFHEGGGWCTGPESCAMRARSNLGTSDILSDSIRMEEAYFSSDPEENSLMHNWNMVMLAYCDGGSFSGDRQTPLVTDSGEALHFRGAAILRAAQETLLGPEYGLAEATDVVVSGCSAGGLAAFMQCDRWAERLAVAEQQQPLGPGAARRKVRCLPDSGMFLDFQDDLAASDAAAFENPGFHAALVWAFDTMELEGDASCMARYAPTNEQWRCAFAQYLFPEVATPTFIVNSKFDAWSLLASGEGSPYAVVGGVLTTLDPAALNEGWGQSFDAAIRTGLEANPGHAAFITACEYHCSLWTTSKVGGFTPAAAFAQWYTHGAQALPSRLLDDGGVFPCPDCCVTDICDAGPALGARVALVPETAPPPADDDDETAAVCRNAFSAGLHEIVDSGRKFLLVVPGTLPAPPAQVPVIIDWHGFTESPHYQNKLTGMAEAAERYGWYAVIPFGTPPRPTDTCCPDDCDEECCQNGRALDPSNACSWNSGSGGCCGAAVEANVDDVQFARDLVEWLSQNTCADTGENVFSTGFSNGAMFSNRLGCEAADLFKGIAPVEGNIQTTQFGDDFAGCTPSESVAWLSFCGTLDGACASNFDASAEHWAAVNSCEGEAQPTFSSATTSCYAWSRCRGSPAQFVEKCWIAGLGHEWSGHTRPNELVDAAALPGTGGGTFNGRAAADIDATEHIFSRFSALTKKSRSVYRLGDAAMQLIGHRGASATHPENTAAAFDEALARGADGVECDLHMLADGTIVVLHDDTLRRTATIPLSGAPTRYGGSFHTADVAEAGRLLDSDASTLSWDEVRYVDVGSSKDPAVFSEERLPRFADFLTQIGSHERKAFVELKGGDVGMVEPAAAAAEAAFAAGEMEERLLTWISFDLELLVAMKARLPRSPAYLVAAVGGAGATDADPAARCTELIDAAAAAGLDGIDLAAIPVVVTESVVSYAKSRGLVVGVWVTESLDVESGWTVFAARGVDYLTTNLPPQIYQVFDRRSKR